MREGTGRNWAIIFTCEAINAVDFFSKLRFSGGFLWR